MVVPKVGRQKVLQQLHMGHPEMSRMKGIARGVVWWPGIDADIENQVRTCAECQEQKSPAAASPMGMASPSLGASPHRLCRSVFGGNVPRGGRRTFQMA